jgi:hypothetical protein
MFSIPFNGIEYKRSGTNRAILLTFSNDIANDIYMYKIKSYIPINTYTIFNYVLLLAHAW